MNIIGEIVMPVKRWWRLLHETGYFTLPVHAAHDTGRCKPHLQGACFRQSWAALCVITHIGPRQHTLQHPASAARAANESRAVNAIATMAVFMA